ncbi:hypothetical protein B0H16DRAFT_1558659 [Mycena metata]|uniref:Uncharacterized protein n=1 Tax=Mycena metata TaxID=1033252 RepID=A0AAD7IMQ4_9AGAR|nr:hypothetical protein B0H16DRAFT_1558659 [Mycena metata]
MEPFERRHTNRLHPIHRLHGKVEEAAHFAHPVDLDDNAYAGARPAEDLPCVKGRLEGHENVVLEGEDGVVGGGGDLGTVLEASAMRVEGAEASRAEDDRHVLHEGSLGKGCRWSGRLRRGSGGRPWVWFGLKRVEKGFELTMWTSGEKCVGALFMISSASRPPHHPPFMISSAYHPPSGPPPSSNCRLSVRVRGEGMSRDHCEAFGGRLRRDTAGRFRSETWRTMVDVAGSSAFGRVCQRIWGIGTLNVRRKKRWTVRATGK